MKRFICIQVISLMVAVIFCLSNAMATGLGFYVVSGAGSADWTCDFESGNSRDFDEDTEHQGGGFVLDTTVARDSVFNYRLNLGYEELVSEYKPNRDKTNMDCYTLDNTFGFGVLRTRVVRLWIGPQLRLALAKGNIEDVSGYDIDLFGLGIGPVIGLNLNFGSVATTAFTIGYRFTHYSGEGKDSDNNDYHNYYDCDYEVDDTEFFFNISMLFRIGDRY